MANQLQITLHGVDRSPALEEDIRSRAEKLQQFHHAITSCRVVVERPHRHHHQGAEFVVCLHLAVPAGDIVVNRDHAQDVHVAVRDAFDAARRRLEDHAQRRDGGARSHRAARNAASGKRGGSDA
jgi:ribosomal subunit interface protein